jgi:hypothetical protein
MLPTLPQVKKLTSVRKGKIGARWKSGDLPDIETWKEYFQHVKQSPFLMGMVEPKQGFKRFQADLEWLTTESKFTKIWENRYHGKN